jgi:hypothetical protein
MPYRFSFGHFGGAGGLFEANHGNDARQPADVPVELQERSSEHPAHPRQRKPHPHDPEKEPLLAPTAPNTSLNDEPNDSAVPMEPDPQPDPSHRRRIAYTGTLYGLINAVILVPVLISFASIIFRDPYFEPSMPYLIKLVILSSCVHQTIFSCISSLPFAIGQVRRQPGASQALARR